MKALNILLAAGCVLGLELGSALGQGIESCNQCICVADSSCDESITTCNTANESGCETVTFTVTCGGNYVMRYSLNCRGAACSECFACVLVTDSNGDLLATCHGPCTNDNCVGECQTLVPLSASEEYKLKVCKRTCFGGSCSNCTSCVARAYIYVGAVFSTACSTIPACNP